MISSKYAVRAVAAQRTAALTQQRRGILGISKALDKRLYRMAKGVMPAISKTEQIALGCGTIGFDRDIFSGSPSLKHLVDTYKPALTAEEQDFVDTKVDRLCSLLNDHDVSVKKDFTKEAWDYMRDEGFFALKIPKEWGGKGFSTQAVSAVLAKLATHCFDANATVAVPNSLGPGELLARYGTPEQKEYFLPRLADGTLIPCFGLTGPHSGSDATSLIGSDCVVQERNGEIGVMANFKKRYITLAPVAGVVGLGLNLSDPDGLLKGKGEEGFSVALLERDHPGLNMGPRHMPLNAAFMNGTVEGQDVWIPMDMILGGQERCGYGWHMFVECLAEGRGVSLPAGSLGAARGVASAVGAYARVRKQFRVPIAEFGGIQEALSKAGSDGLITIAGCDLMNCIVDNHEAPMVISSVMKQNITERGRRIVEHGMDIAAGSAICRGDKNYVGNGYMAIPIAITVEGANIMTRSFQIIGQGLTRCHPHMLELINSLQMPQSQEKEGVEIFKKQFYKVVGHGVTNFAASVGRGVGSTVSTATRSKTAYKDGKKLLDYHEKQLQRLSANFALTADLCFTLGGKLKFEELLMGRLADALGSIFLGYATLHHYTRMQGKVDGLEALTEHAMLRLETEAQDALKEAADNFPGPLGGVASFVMRLGCFPLGSLTRPYKPPSDTLTKEVSRMMTTPSGVRDMFEEGVYMAPDGQEHQVSDLIRALPTCVQADKIASQLRREKRAPTDAEADVLAQAEALRDVLIQVDVFPKLAESEDPLKRPALVGTEERLANLERKSFAA
uniref:Acyl-coenzyme A dehydrogenase n=1 Tax=Grammatophora oceanica TaxID=210454 RepID=A0A7S1VST6_9STRA|mmetsp:Transcript_6086/g.8720  ORF Transcript_6086/g.8720 Transcript_6086/m.8720 type:complete len:787 (+) Transcript_6086:72-2432(+)|eukprot:CAMPEP_0194047196 /NCGR_PEP_ID=MMETSP0009_2-20130614/23609_1 /TAXON_ID=210454 /ORGANISM="Grammatophora oceanica, Strain CCMP 410" /LENGTH=786 /DNA_ID=CAMNT_0038692735 /DNA_START=36 /DNA_END=2396 /DNA_ORIENTATION=-